MAIILKESKKELTQEEKEKMINDLKKVVRLMKEQRDKDISHYDQEMEEWIINGLETMAAQQNVEELDLFMLKNGVYKEEMRWELGRWRVMNPEASVKQRYEQCLKIFSKHYIEKEQEKQEHYREKPKKEKEMTKKEALRSAAIGTIEAGLSRFKTVEELDEVLAYMNDNCEYENGLPSEIAKKYGLKEREKNIKR